MCARSRCSATKLSLLLAFELLQLGYCKEWQRLQMSGSETCFPVAMNPYSESERLQGSSQMLERVTMRGQWIEVQACAM